ncbi:hypothetical protein FE275_28015 [Pseudomonas koreensis]|uniref:hypothetical protein n=1 Tax=Pseudomonas koreensis TaxID=198620 RepID=UPI001239AA56|nr:hypothetical protein [Pseudomonas koreensis]KAA8737109.1 hypothetical protein FE275_28015 [Pseudomonas koreensis]
MLMFDASHHFIVGLNARGRAWVWQKKKWRRKRKHSFVFLQANACRPQDFKVSVTTENQRVGSISLNRQA